MATKAEPASPSKMSTSSHAKSIECPDPSMHRDTRLQEQASTAALYVTQSHKGSEGSTTGSSGVPKESILDANNRLSSKSAATSLKYARAQDLPSFPTVGIPASSNSANTAANLANTNQKPFEHWKPDPSSNAGKAAMMAKDYKMAPMWKPELSAAGSKAALLAARDGGKLDLWMPEATAEGNSAATLALRNKGLSPQLDYGYTDEGHRRALLAATGALNRSKSDAVRHPVVAPPAYPDSANSAHNALNAATVAHKPSVRKSNPDSNAIDSDAMRAARIQNLNPNVSREMWGEHPPVELEVEERKRQDALRASAVSMARQIYTQREQKRKDDEAAELAGATGASAATYVHNRTPSSSTAAPDVRQQALQYIHLQAAAQKLADERLAKLDPDGIARYREHYGYDAHKPRSRLSLRGRQRRRADSDLSQTQKTTIDDDDSSDDEMRSRRIRNQMNQFTNSVADLEAKKRAADRAGLLAAAEKKVQAQMNTMDERVFQDTGKVSPAMMEEWERKARARATADSESRQKNYGKVNIGGGRYMDQSELDAIAAARLQPTLNEISDAAEKKRAHDEEIRLQQEEKKREMTSEKEREREIKAEQKRLQNEEKLAAKQARAEQKANARMEKEAEKSRRAEEKRAAKEDKRRSRDAKKDALEVTAASVAAADVAEPEPAHDVETAAAPVVEHEHERESTEEAEPTATAVPVIVEPTLTRTGTNATTGSDGNLRPDLERHVSRVLTSSSEGGSSVSSSSSSEVSSIHSRGSHVAAVPANDSDAAQAIAHRVISAPVVDESAAPAVTETVATTAPPEPTTATTTDAIHDNTTSPTSPTSPTSAASKAKSGRFSGFFTKFKRRSEQREPGAFGSRTSHDQREEAATDKAAAELVAGTSATAPAGSLVGGAHAAGDEHDGADDRASQSSFQRHATDLRSISSLSSSDDEEERRGRTGKVSGSGVGASALAGEDTEDEEEFEEARDTFDDAGLAPMAASSAVPRRSVSPVRETKFQEEL